MLRVNLIGNLGREPETRFTARGTQIVQFSVAVNQVRTGADGERQENTDWFRVRVTGRQAEYAQRPTMGQRVLVIGNLTIGHYESKDGEQRVSYDIWADEVQNISAREEGGAAPRPANAPAQAASVGASNRGQDDEFEDLPF